MRCLLLVFADLVADQPADCRATDCADAAAAGENCTRNCADARADCSALVKVDILLQPPRPSRAAAVIVLIAKFFIVFI